MTLEERVKGVIAEQLWQIITLQQTLQLAADKLKFCEDNHCQPEEAPEE